MEDLNEHISNQQETDLGKKLFFTNKKIKFSFSVKKTDKYPILIC